MIRALRRSRLSTLVWVLALTTFWFVAVRASAVHTDDGCQVELHCVACHWALSGRADIAQHQAQLPPPEMVGRAAISVPQCLITGLPPEPTTRGPPTV